MKVWRFGLPLTLAFTVACGGPDPDPGTGVGGSATSSAGSAGTAGIGETGGSGGGSSTPPPPSRLPGSACLPSAEFDAAFAGFAASDVTVEARSPYCAEGAVCLVDHFQGRVSCPYGQAASGSDASVGCSLPGSDTRVSAAVEPQRLDRRAQDAVYCSCRCAGPDPNASYCPCAAGFECVERVPALSSAQDPELVGSYCVRGVDAAPNPVALTAAPCELGSQGCGEENRLPASMPALAPPAPAPSATASPFLAPFARARKLDLLFMIDNSISMAGKQELLSRSLAELLERVANPICLDAAGNEHPAPPPGGACPQGQTRQFEPFTDLHVGFISSSLSDVGANTACPPEGFPRYVADRDDRGHLLGSLPRGQDLGANAQGFLSWSAGEAGFSELTASARRLLLAAGEKGCGWEQSLEAWYRFLIDPTPYRGLTRVVCTGSSSQTANCVQPAKDAAGRILLDDELLAQRQAFLRPDSTLAIVMLSDENDCSLQVGNQTWVVVNTEDPRPFFRGSSACASDPNDKCCYACPLQPPAGCAVDPACTADAANPNRLAPAQDGHNLRCFDQKRRFGVDFLYPTQRYVNALITFELCKSTLDLSTTDCALADLFANPLYDPAQRSRSQVVISGLLGVPWQPLAAEHNAAGSTLPPEVLRFKSSSELSAQGDDTWAQVLGSPGVPWRAASGTRQEVLSVPRIPPALPQMVESELPRAGVAPGNPINGDEFDTASRVGGTPDDLEYACIYPLPSPIDCAALDPSTQNCDCFGGDNTSPVCEATPGVSSAGTTQYWGKAYPGLRQLQVLKELGENAVVGSACPRNTSNPVAPDYVYRPAIGALLERLQAAREPGP
jgi:hypothetical protein